MVSTLLEVMQGLLSVLSMVTVQPEICMTDHDAKLQTHQCVA